MAVDKPEVAVLAENQGLLIDDITVKAWTLRQVIDVSAVLTVMVDTLKEKGITFDQLAELFDKDAPEKDLSAVYPLIQILLPCLPKFLSISLNKSIDEVQEFDAGDTAILTIRIIALNLENLRRFFGQMVMELRGMFQTPSLSPKQ